MEKVEIKLTYLLLGFALEFALEQGLDLELGLGEFVFPFPFLH